MVGQQKCDHAPDFSDPASSHHLDGVVQRPPLYRHADLGLVSMRTARQKAGGQEEMGPNTRGRRERIDGAEQTGLPRDQASLLFQFPGGRRLRILSPDTAPGRCRMRRSWR